MKTMVRNALAAFCGLSTVSTVSRATAATQVFVAGTGNDQATPACPSNRIGEKSCPARTLSRGVALAAAQGGGEVRVAAGIYDGHFALPSGVTVAGGYDATFTESVPLSAQDLASHERIPQKYPASSTRLTATTADRVVLARGLRKPTGLRNLVLFGPDVTAKWAVASYVIVAEDGGPLTLERVKLVAGHGQDGAPGTHGAPATTLCMGAGAGGGAVHMDTLIEKGYTSMFGHSDPDTRLLCESRDGAPGASPTNPQGGGLGGRAGVSYCLSEPFGAGGPRSDRREPPEGGPGNPGEPGKTGLEGTAGAAGSDRAGSFARDVNGVLWWNAKPGGSRGGDGLAGDGGGGGGAGGSRNSTWSTWLNYMSCWSRVRLGGRGGDGGRGGCGGTGGGAGGPGGGSFAFALKDISVVARNVVILQGQGGTGGPGGDGGAGRDGEPLRDGQKGEPDECGGVVHWSGTGGPGGAGGRGGQGGGGAGGNGGPSIAVAMVGNVKLDRDDTFDVLEGAGGAGGAGGKSGGEPHGEPGLPGLNAQEYEFDSNR